MSASGFPARPAPATVEPVEIGALRLRPARDGDLGFLRRLYHSFRAEEMAAVPWSQAAKEAFLDDQFRLQHQYFTTVFADADFLVVERAGASIGRLYLHRGETGVLVVDIGLTPEARRLGHGRRLIEWVLKQASEARAPRVWLHVLPQNRPARRLYEQLGFVVVGEENARLRMDRPLAS